VTRERKAKTPPPPLDSAKLRALALHYVGRYATTKAKLRTYLARKIRERGWTDEAPIDLEILADEFSEMGYVNDVAVAESRSRSFVRRGYGLRRLNQDLDAAGISHADSANARDEAEAAAWQSAENFARRKRIGPFAKEFAPPELRQKQLQAFLRAGHSYDLAKVFVRSEPGSFPSMDC
jgi:regulatory protein